MESRLSTMETKLNEVEDKIDSIDEKLNQVIEALVGNKITKNGGIVDDVKYLEDRVAKHDEIAKRLRWSWAIILGITAIVSFIIEVLVQYFKK